MMEFQIEVIIERRFHRYRVLWNKGLGVETFWVQARNGEMVIESNRVLIERLDKPREQIYWRVVKGKLRVKEIQDKIVLEIQKYVAQHGYWPMKVKKPDRG